MATSIDSIINGRNRLLTPKETGGLLGVSVETLATWRSTGRYPLKYVKVGKLVRYRQADVEEFINSRIQGCEDAS